MKGNVLTEIPSELVSAAKDGRVASSEGIYDYILLKNQEDINQEMTTAVETMALSLLDWKEKVDNIETIENSKIDTLF